MQSYFARQPIFSLEGKCVAYEILHRHAQDQNYATVTDNTKATTSVMLNLMQSIGNTSALEEKNGFINIDEFILMDDFLLLFPKDKFIFEILETTKITQKVIEKVAYFYNLGYRFALDDFVYHEKDFHNLKKLFPFIDILKVDLLEQHQIPIEEISQKTKPFNLKLLAEKVENIEMFERCRNSGYDLFQGYFFEKPTIIVGKKIEPTVSCVIDIINTIHATSDLQTITDKFSDSPELTFGLLQYINSASYSFKNEITSIRQILQLLGPNRLQSWLGLLMYSSQSEPLFGEEIIKSAKYRALMMSKLALASNQTNHQDEAFLTGSLSLIDTYLNIDMRELLGGITLSSQVTQALLCRKGYLGELLLVTEELETSEDLLGSLEANGKKFELSPSELYALFCEANRIYLKTST